MGYFETRAAAPLAQIDDLRLGETTLPAGEGEQLHTDGRKTFRPLIIGLDLSQEAELVRLLLALDAPSRVSRFLFAASDRSLIEHARRALSTAAWVAGAIVEGGLRGIAEIYDIGATGGVEAAFLVDRDWRRQGLGTALLRASQHWAAESKRAAIRMVFSRGNWPMRRLASTANARLDLALDEISAELPVGEHATAACR